MEQVKVIACKNNPRILGELYTVKSTAADGALYVDYLSSLPFMLCTDGTYANKKGTVVAPLDWVGPTPVPTADESHIPSEYPDGNPKSAQGAKKHSLRLIPTAALVAESEAFADGVQKYGAANWRETGVAASVYIDAAMRHMALYFDGGEDRASDSGAKHLGHARACLGIILDAEAAGKLIDDRPTPMPGLAELLVK